MQADTGSILSSSTLCRDTCGLPFKCGPRQATGPNLKLRVEALRTSKLRTRGVYSPQDQAVVGVTLCSSLEVLLLRMSCLCATGVTWVGKDGVESQGFRDLVRYRLMFSCCGDGEICVLYCREKGDALGAMCCIVAVEVEFFLIEVRLTRSSLVVSLTGLLVECCSVGTLAAG